MKPAAAERVYLRQVYLSDICFLNEVLYWVAFQRLPLHYADLEGNEVRSVVMLGYRTDFDFADHRLTDDECTRAGLPPDPRNFFGWASDIALSDDLEKLAASIKEGRRYRHPGKASSWNASMLRAALRAAVRAALPAAIKDAVRWGKAATAVRGAPLKEVAKLHNKLERWKPTYKRVIELPAAKVYVALKEGKIRARGILLPNVDLEAALDSLVKRGRNLSNFKDIEIPREFWSEQEIFWELSAARNDREHYCQINCLTEEVLALFPCDLTSGTPVSVEQFGSTFVLEDLGGNGRVTKRPATQHTRRPGRPQQYPWEDVYIEIAALIAAEGLPEKKEACIAFVQHWFIRQNLSPPSRAAIGEKLTRYYNRIVRSGGHKKRLAHLPSNG